MANELDNNNCMEYIKAKGQADAKGSLIYKLIGGSLIGLANGFFGGGGGMLAVPLLTLMLSMENKKAHASAISIMLPLSIASSIVYITKIEIEWGTLLNVLFGVVIGSAIGAFILNKLKNNVVGYIFAVIMVVAGIRMLF